MKHSQALGIEAKVNYLTRIKDYNTFKNMAEEMKTGWMFKKKHLLGNYSNIRS